VHVHLKKAIIVYDTKYGNSCSDCWSDNICRLWRNLLIQDAKHDNTGKIALALSKGLKSAGLATRDVFVWQVTAAELDPYDLIAVGGPTYAFGMMTDEIKEFMKKMEKANLKGKKAFAFDTRFRRTLFKSASGKIEDAFRALQVEIVKNCSSAIVNRTNGCLEEGEEEKFRQIGSEIAKQIL
jgi:flavodoxin